MQTTLARRQRHRRALNRQPTGRSGTVIRATLIAIPIVFLLVTILLAGAGALFTVAAYNFYSQGLPDPSTALKDLRFEQQTIVYDRTGKVELARLGTLRREVATFKDVPPRCSTRRPRRGPVLLDEPGLRSVRDHQRRPRYPRRAPARRLDDHPAARARPLLPPEAFADSTYERKVREIIQSIRLTEAYPGDQGKQDIITAYLNQNFYGNQTYGVKAAARGYFGKSLSDLTLAQFAILAAIPQSPTKFDLMRNAERSVSTRPAEPGLRPGVQEQPAAGPAHDPRSSSGATTSSI
jgi:penicillin-binding protein 1A